MDPQKHKMHMNIGKVGSWALMIIEAFSHRSIES